MTARSGEPPGEKERPTRGPGGRSGKLPTRATSQSSNLSQPDLPDKRSLEFARRGWRIIGSAARDRARLVRLRDGDPLLDLWNRTVAIADALVLADAVEPRR